MKTAYPNFDDYQETRPIYNIGKWMDAMKDIYVKVHLGMQKPEAVNATTKEWGNVEKTDFMNWLKYYESGDQYKYKRAQVRYYVNDDLNYFLPNPKPAVPSPIKTVNEQIDAAPSQAADDAAKKQSENDKRKTIEEQRKKILGRLNSAEKLLSSQQGQMFAGADFERLLTAIFELKKQIQTVNKMSTASMQTIIDLVCRQANILMKEGYVEPSKFMVKLAQSTPGDFSVNLGELPTGGSVPLGGGSLGNMAPRLDQPAHPSKEITEDSAVGQFIDNLEDSGITDTTDQKKDEDKLLAEDKDDIEMDDDVLLEQEIMPENELTVEAQAVPAAPAPTEPKPKENLEVETPEKKPTNIAPEDVRKAPSVETRRSNIDDILDSALNNITIEDVIAKMEEINNIFRMREIPRQIAICDLMLSRLGIAQFVPELSEILNKNLDSSQYSLIRMENILSRLHGSVKTKEIDLTGKEQKLTPGAEAVKQNLENMEEKEKQRKDVKKQLADQAALEKATKPEGEVENPREELAAAPVEVEAPAAPAAPAAAPRPAPVV